MKSLSQASFFRVFDVLLGEANPGLKLTSWTHDGITWERERHSFNGVAHGLSIEIVSVSRPGKRGWRVLVVKEYWWAGQESRAIKAVRWAKATGGQSSDILAWFRGQEVLLERQLAKGEEPRLRVSIEEDADE
jgi:hypothetical protein